MKRNNQHSSQDQFSGSQQWQGNDFEDLDNMNDRRRSMGGEGAYDQNWQEHAGNRSHSTDQNRGSQTGFAQGGAYQGGYQQGGYQGNYSGGNQGGFQGGFQGGNQSGRGYNQGSRSGYPQFGGYPQQQAGGLGSSRQSWSPSQSGYQHRGDEGEFGQYDQGRSSGQQRSGQRSSYGSLGQGYPRSGEFQDSQSSGYGGFGMEDDFRGGQYGYGTSSQRQIGQSGGQGQHRSSWGSESQLGGSGMGTQSKSQRGSAPRSYKRTDERIQEDVCEQLMDAGIDCSNVDVSVTIGVVSLTGEVNKREDKHEIERVAANVSGVQDVDNRIKLARQGRKDSSSSTDSDATKSDANRSGNGATGGYSSSGLSSGSTSKSSTDSSSSSSMRK